MLLDDGSDELSFLSLRHFFLSYLFFFDDKSGNDGSGSGSYGTCSFPFSSENSVGPVSISKYVGCVSGIFYVGCVSGILKVGRIG